MPDDIHTTHSEPVVNFELAKSMGLIQEEYDEIINRLGRIPTFTELGIYSVMWSEHCSYKNSIVQIKTLPRSGGRLLVGAGEENAGLVDIGDGYAVAFKIESHNHPSAIEPYQGAATGVGGIHRDIFTMGARPIASLNSLRFGPLDQPKNQWLLDGVVRGIAGYGNSFGVPTVGGEIYFDACYTGNPLVNAMSIGLVKSGETASAIAKGSENPVIIVGSATGRDGIHGATFASEEISEASEDKRPSVQVGDPFTEKLLLEATLEALATGHVVGIQDMGAAGISCSTSEMSAKGQSGMAINLDKVPIRESGMSAYEIMLSESQERMLVVAQKGHEEQIIRIFEKWDLNATIIGYVTNDEYLKIYKDGELKADIKAFDLVLGGGAPVYQREQKKPGYIDQLHSLDVNQYQIKDLKAETIKLISSPTIASKRWVFEQYDYMVRTNTASHPGGSDAAVIRLKEVDKALASSTDCNSRFVYLNPRKGGAIAVAEAARNVACTGAEPLAITNCLNFGNPYKPEIYWQFAEAIAGIGEACRAFNTPVTGGNVSFYNENPSGAIYPTPTIGMLGMIENYHEYGHLNSGIKNAGDVVYLLGKHAGHMGGSEYLNSIHQVVAGDAPDIDLQQERHLHQFLQKGLTLKLLESAHDCSEGGLLIGLLEKFILRQSVNLGVEIDYKGETLNQTQLYFSEDQGRVMITANPEKGEALESLAHNLGLSIKKIGTVTESDTFQMNGELSFLFDEISEHYMKPIQSLLNR